MSVDMVDPDLLERVDVFFRRYYKEEITHLAQRYPNEQCSLYIDWRDIYQFDTEIANDYINSPGQMREYFEEALRQYDLPIDVSLSRAHVRVHHLDDANVFQVGGYSPSQKDGEYMELSGQVAITSKVKPKPLELAFDCQRCGTTSSVPQSDTGIQEPYECSGCERQGPFQIDHEQSEFVDVQQIRLKQPPEETNGGSGEDIDVIVHDDLVDRIRAGDHATIAGTLRMIQPSQTTSGSTATFETYFEGEAITIDETDFEDIKISPDEREEIKALAQGEHGDPYELLVDSLAPTIQGEEFHEIKEAIILQMFKGVRTKNPDGSVDRGNSHILLLGDPGTAKSTLLNAAHSLSPRSVYASGDGASAAGMTAAVVSDKGFGTSEWTVEAGALVIANNGIACVDEIDKVHEDAVSSMHEALSNGRVSVNKAGINTTLCAETALLAAGNPKYGRFDPYKSIGDQINLSPTLLSRFDLMFMLQDTPNIDRDGSIARSKVRSKRTAKAIQNGEDVATEDRKRVEPAIDHELIRKWIALANQRPAPCIRDDAVEEEMAEAFVTIRGMNGYSEDAPVPITWRKLEGIQRLAEQSAKIRLSDTIKSEDVQRAQQRIGSSLRQVGMDTEEGTLDADVIETGAAKSQRDRMQTLEALILEMQTESKGGIPYEKLYKQTDDQGLDREKVEDAIENLKDKGQAYEPSDGRIRLIK